MTVCKICAHLLGRLVAHNSHYIFIGDCSQAPKQSTVAVGNGAVLKGFKQGSSGISLLFLKLDCSSVS